MARVAAAELTRVEQQVTNATYAPFLVYRSIWAICFVLYFPLSLVSRWLETQLAKYDRRASARPL